MDTLKPFTTLIRALRTSARNISDSKETSPATARQQVAEPAAQVSGIPSVATVRARLQSRLITLPEWAPKRARELFVECIMLGELGEELSADPAFHDLVQRVSLALESNEQISKRLDDVLRELPRGSS